MFAFCTIDVRLMSTKDPRHPYQNVISYFVKQNS